MICHSLLIFSLLVSVAVVGEGATAAYEPTDLFLFNCGATSVKIDNNGRNWTAENQEFLPSNSENASFISDTSYQESGVSQVPYLTVRIFLSTFTYSIPVSPGLKFIRLYFYPTRYKSGFDAVNSFFSVTVNGFTLLHNFSVKAFIPESNSLIKEFIVPVYQTLNLTFTPSPNSLGFVNGIEIVSMPDRFYSKGGFDDMITNVGSPVNFPIDNSTAFETVYRLNIGGQTISDIDDSGMFRQWLSDDVFGAFGVFVSIPGVKINYSEKTPAYVAPEDVYTTSRAMGNAKNPNLNLNYKLTWPFTVDARFGYLVRLHFCEIQQEVNETSQRVFSIFIQNQTAMPALDVFRLSGGSRIPMYLDFYIYVDADGTSQQSDIRLQLQTYRKDNPTYYDAILNGVEILKLNDPGGNLAGPNPDPQTSPPPQSVRPPKRNDKSNVLPLILAVVGSAVALAIFVVVVVLVVMKRKKKSNESSVNTTNKPSTNSSWGPLPHGTGSTNTKSASSLPSDLCRRFSIYEIKSATNDFEEKLIIGVGGFGSVYKGRIDGGATLVAVKRLEITSNQGAKEFETELEMLSKLRHVIDSDLTADITATSMEKFCEIAIRCVQDRGMERPPMNDVVWALEFALQLHETAKKRNDNVESLDDLMPSGVVETNTDGEDDLFSRTTGHVGKSTTTDDSVLVVGDERSGSSWGVFSEINEPKAR
ncbi:unnamed protein product [Arabidopsis thaliana]|uniref:(thale cress) hypothetical protein n=1 Tax=Arabidopsis thaliana TaxID=3702 RepID=A0A7G2FEF7_ARATH|nr:unnamed protein product [Arabidopsis thaliana]